jgi:aspartyl-tRNA(Asn)/glutamyl-tRNA(Gln) amidotransferase subunit C
LPYEPYEQIDMIDIEQVKHIAKLSRLELTPEEEKKYSEQLSSILDYVEQLNEVNTDGIPPMANITGMSNVFRDDGVEPSGISHTDIAQNAPEFRDGSFVVPGVFE